MREREKADNRNPGQHRDVELVINKNVGLVEI